MTSQKDIDMMSNSTLIDKMLQVTEGNESKIFTKVQQDSFEQVINKLLTDKNEYKITSSQNKSQPRIAAEVGYQKVLHKLYRLHKNEVFGVKENQVIASHVKPQPQDFKSTEWLSS